MSNIEEILSYWFGAGGEPITLTSFKERTKLWFFKNTDTDDYIRAHYDLDVERAARGELDAWADSPRGRLALVLLLDQFPRNLHRGSALAFRTDPQARAWVIDAVDRGVDARLSADERFVFYLPLMHSEEFALQKRCVDLYARLSGDAPLELKPEFESAHAFAIRHREVIERFGRFPHRNVALGRASSEEEIAFLKEPNSSF